MTSIPNIRPYAYAAAGILVITAFVGGIKYFQTAKQKDTSFIPPPTAVNVSVVEKQQWTTSLNSVGTVYAEEGMTIAAEVVGRVTGIHFVSGDYVESGALLLSQDSGNEHALLQSAKAQLRLAESTFARTERLRAQGTVSISSMEEAQQELDSARAHVQNLETTLSKKRIKAPFSGRLGIRRVDQGEDLAVGDAIVELHTQDRLKVNFTLPQRWFSQLKKGLTVDVNMLEEKDQSVLGEINAIASKVNELTRSIEVQAYLDNAEGKLLPGMAVEVRVVLPEKKEHLVIPATAILYAPFGDSVFITEMNDEKKQLVARQQFIRISDRRGDFVAVSEGLSEGDQVVSAGAFKLFSGQAVIISEKPETAYSLDPSPSDS